MGEVVQSLPLNKKMSFGSGRDRQKSVSFTLILPLQLPTAFFRKTINYSLESFSTINLFL